MATGRQASFVICVTAVLLSAAGCIGDDPTGPPSAAQWAAIAGPDLNCPDHATVRPGSLQFYDITGDGSTESFVDLICAGSDAAKAPDQLEVFRGTSRSSRLARLTSIAARPDEQVFLAHGCIYFTGDKVIVIGRMRSSANASEAPTVVVTQISTWTNGKMRTEHPVTLRSAGGLPPGCP